MNFNVRNIGGNYQEMTVDAIETGTLDKKEAIRLAQKMVSAAEELLRGCDVKAETQMCGTIAEYLTEYL